MTFEKGLHEVAAGVWAYLQPDGGWGWSNAGLVVDGDSVTVGRHPVRYGADPRDAGQDDRRHRAYGGNGTSTPSSTPTPMAITPTATGCCEKAEIIAFEGQPGGDGGLKPRRAWPGFRRRRAPGLGKAGE